MSTIGAAQFRFMPFDRMAPYWSAPGIEYRQPRPTPGPRIGAVENGSESRHAATSDDQRRPHDRARRLSRLV